MGLYLPSTEQHALQALLGERAAPCLPAASTCGALQAAALPAAHAHRQAPEPAISALKAPLPPDSGGPQAGALGDRASAAPVQAKKQPPPPPPPLPASRPAAGLPIRTLPGVSISAPPAPPPPPPPPPALQRRFTGKVLAGPLQPRPGVAAPPAPSPPPPRPSPSSRAAAGIVAAAGQCAKELHGDTAAQSCSAHQQQDALCPSGSPADAATDAADLAQDVATPELCSALVNLLKV